MYGKKDASHIVKETFVFIKTFSFEVFKIKIWAQNKYDMEN